MKLNSCELNAKGFLIHILRSVQVKWMALHPMKSLQLGAILALAIVLAQPGSVQAIGILNSYVEVGDAGNSLNTPQFITGGPYDGITGSFSAATDVDVFAFYWTGGNFTATFYSSGDPGVAVYGFSANLIGSATGSGVFSLAIPNLPAGNYLLQILDQPDGVSQYDVSFNGPISAPTAIPEPATMLLLGSGLVGIVGLRKRFRK